MATFISKKSYRVIILRFSIRKEPINIWILLQNWTTKIYLMCFYEIGGYLQTKPNETERGKYNFCNR